MMKTLSLLFCLLIMLSFQFCTTSKQAASDKKKATPTPAISYTADIAPILQARCTPCHFPDGGKRKFLDTHAAVKDNIGDILHRVQLPQDSSAFMPFKLKKEPLSDSMIQVLKVWKESGMAG